jgi:hypothetical protein
LQESWILGLTGVPDHITTSLQYANHFLPDADSLKPTQVVCVAGEAVAGRQYKSCIPALMYAYTIQLHWATCIATAADCQVKCVKADGSQPGQGGGGTAESDLLGMVSIVGPITTQHWSDCSLLCFALLCCAVVPGAQGSLRELASRVWSRQLKLSEANTWAFIQSSYVVR